MRILPIECDEKTADYIVGGIEGAGHAGDLMEDGREGLCQATREPHDVQVTHIRHLRSNTDKPFGVQWLQIRNTGYSLHAPH